MTKNKIILGAIATVVTAVSTLAFKPFAQGNVYTFGGTKVACNTVKPSPSHGACGIASSTTLYTQPTAPRTKIANNASLWAVTNQ